MKIRRFYIENYKAIKNVEVNLRHSINPIIGINESGKTSVLQAILCFDKTRDKYYKGKHLDYKNKYEINPKTVCTIQADLELTKDEYQEIIESIGISTQSEDYSELLQLQKSKSLLKLIRTLSGDGRPYSLPDVRLTDTIKKKLINKLLKRLPYILYFDDFTDRVPEEIEFNPNYQNTGTIKGRNKEWQEIVEELFKRVFSDGLNEDETDEEKPLITFLKKSDGDKEDDILSDVTDILETEIIEEWKNLKKRGFKNLADDSEKLELSIKYDGASTFQFKVRDKSNKNKRRTFNVNERSKGFQWFFNYMIKLKFNPRYKESNENSIYLLDEPGSYLHSSAQSELLKELKEVSKRNTILYCTHSHYLLDPKQIKLGSIKIAEKKNAEIDLISYGNYHGNNNKGALSPVFEALGLNYARDFTGKIAITEGIIDYYFIDLMQKHLSFFKNIKIIPGGGSGNLTTLISFGLSFSDDFVVIFDNDGGGKNGIKKYIREFGEEIQNKFTFYKKEPCKLEKLISKNDTRELLKATNSKDLKKAIPIVFFDKTFDEQKKIMNSISKETIDNFKHLNSRIKMV